MECAIAGIAIIERETRSIVFALTEPGITRRTFAVLALVSSSAEVAIVAIILVGQVETEPCSQVAKVIGAGILVIAIWCAWSRCTGPRLADVTQGTEIAIVTGGTDGRIDASGIGQAAIGSAGVIIVAIGSFSDADSSQAGVPNGASITVIALPVHGLVETGAVAKIASVKGAGIAILTALGGAGITGPLRAGVTQGARIAVVAGERHGQVRTAALSSAGIFGTWILIVTGDELPTLTGSVETYVTDRAPVAIIAAAPINVRVDALTGCRVARAIGTRGPALAIYSFSLAYPLEAGIVLGTRGVIVTDDSVDRLMRTPSIRFAGIDGTAVSVVTCQTLPHALSVQTLVIGGANATIVAGSCASQEEAGAVIGATAIGSTGIGVIAALGCGGTDSSTAMVINRAVVKIITGKPIVRREAARPVITSSFSTRSRRRAVMVFGARQRPLNLCSRRYVLSGGIAPLQHRVRACQGG